MNTGGKRERQYMGLGGRIKDTSKGWQAIEKG